MLTRVQGAGRVFPGGSLDHVHVRPGRASRKSTRCLLDLVRDASVVKHRSWASVLGGLDLESW